MQARYFESIVVSNMVVTLDPALVTPPDTARSESAIISVDGNSIRFRIDGGDPTANEGHQLFDGDLITIMSHDSLRKLKMIRSGISDATVHITYIC